MTPSRLIGWLATLSGLGAMAVMVVATLLAVVARYLRVTGLEWSYEVAGMAFIWVTFLGAAVAETRHENAAFDVLKRAAPRPARLALDGLARAALALVGGVLLVSGVAMLRQSALVPTPLLRWPDGVVGAAVPVLGAALSVLAARRRAGP
jgi:TRAP-type C4-dicarboxylate transport system permease small subunit